MVSDSTEPNRDVERMEAIRKALEQRPEKLPEPRGGGSVANTADLLARSGLSCALMGVGGNDPFGHLVLSNCKKASLESFMRFS